MTSLLGRPSSVVGFKQWIEVRKQECCHCRECGHSVQPFDEICAACGVLHPAKVSLSVAAAVGIVVTLLVFVWTTW